MISKQSLISMKNELFSRSRSYGLLCLIAVIYFSCTEQKNERKISPTIKSENKENQLVEDDSITFSMRFDTKGITGFNIEDNYFHSYYLEFSNPTERDTTISKKVPRIHKNEIVFYGGGYFVDGNTIFYSHYYFINKNINKIEFEFVKGDVIIKNQPQLFIADSLFKSYIKFGKKVPLKHVSVKELENELSIIFLEFKEKFSSKKNKIALLLNEYQFFDKLQMIYPLDDRIEDYLKKIDTIVAGEPIDNLIFNFAKNKINKLNYYELNSDNYSQQYIDLVSIGIFNFLRFEDNKGDKNYKNAKEWLMSTNLYKKDSVYVKKEITPINKEKFKEKLKNLDFTDIKNVNLDLQQIISQNPTDYYLIDFWATWCAPCIQGVKTMNEMQFPKNVKVISISVDKEKDKQKWIKLTNKLEQSITYLVDDTKDNTKKFMKFIEMQSVPRYILIDKNMNLIDQAFYHPHEPQFLPKLKDVENNKYW